MEKLKYSCFLLAIVFFAHCNPKHNAYHLSGDIKGIKEGKITLSYFDRESFKAVKVDSAEVINGKFKMKGVLNAPQELGAFIIPGNYSFLIWLENKKITVKGDIKGVEADRYGRKELPVEISGSHIQNEYQAYKALKAGILKELKPLSMSYDKENMAYIQAIKVKKDERELERLKHKAEKAKEKMEPFFAQLEKIDFKYIEDHPQSFVTASILRNRLSYITVLESQQYYNRFSEEIKNSFIGRVIKREIEKNIKGAPGSMAGEFRKADINGDTLSLLEFRGQYVVLDFWASWCKPCRAGNPHLIKLYTKYHDDGIEFIGIASDDNNIPAWHKAVEKDNIGIWRHILSGDKRKGHSIGDKYAIHTLPTKILIDPEGKIIGRYGADGESDEDMDKKLKDIFGH